MCGRHTWAHRPARAEPDASLGECISERCRCVEVNLFSADVLAHLVHLMEAAADKRVLSLLLSQLYFDGG